MNRCVLGCVLYWLPLNLLFKLNGDCSRFFCEIVFYPFGEDGYFERILLVQLTSRTEKQSKTEVKKFKIMREETKTVLSSFMTFYCRNKRLFNTNNNHKV